jgi:hypothetical protein
MESDENQKSALEKLKDSIKKEGLVEVFKRFNEVVDTHTLLQIYEDTTVVIRTDHTMAKGKRTKDK